MKWYRIIAVINTLLFLAVSAIIWALISFWAYEFYIAPTAMHTSLPLPSIWAVSIFRFFEYSLAFPYVIFILWFFFNIFLMEFLIRRKTDKVELLFIHLEILIGQFLLFLLITMLLLGALQLPLYTGIVRIPDNYDMIYRLDKILALLMVVLIFAGFIATRIIYRKRMYSSDASLNKETKETGN